MAVTFFEICLRNHIHTMNLFLAGFSYLEPLCATVATAATAPSSVAHQDKRAKLVHISPFSLIDKSLQIKLWREVSFFCKIHFHVFKFLFLNKTSNHILFIHIQFVSKTKNKFQLGKTVPTTCVHLEYLLLFWARFFQYPNRFLMQYLSIFYTE